MSVDFQGPFTLLETGSVGRLTLTPTGMILLERGNSDWTMTVKTRIAKNALEHMAIKNIRSRLTKIYPRYVD